MDKINSRRKLSHYHVMRLGAVKRTSRHHKGGGDSAILQYGRPGNHLAQTNFGAQIPQADDTVRIAIGNTTHAKPTRFRRKISAGSLSMRMDDPSLLNHAWYISRFWADGGVRRSLAPLQ